MLTVCNLGNIIFTLCLQVFGKKDNTANSSSGKDYLSSHFSDLRSAGDKSKLTASASNIERRTLQKQKELEKLLMKAENEEINDTEMSELKRRLLETEAQMSRILQAMEVVQQKVGTAADLRTGTENEDMAPEPDSTGVEEDLEDVGNAVPRVIDDDDTDELSADGEIVDDNDCASSTAEDGDMDLT
jgi:hypothetical protein